MKEEILKQKEDNITTILTPIPVLERTNKKVFNECCRCHRLKVFKSNEPRICQMCLRKMRKFLAEKFNDNDTQD